MGITAENVATKFQITRDEQDKFAFNSQTKALKAQEKNKFNDEITAFKIKSKESEIMIQFIIKISTAIRSKLKCQNFLTYIFPGIFLKD